MPNLVKVKMHPLPEPIGDRDEDRADRYMYINPAHVVSFWPYTYKAGFGVWTVDRDRTEVETTVCGTNGTNVLDISCDDFAKLMRRC